MQIVYKIYGDEFIYESYGDKSASFHIFNVAFLLSNPCEQSYF